MDIVNLHMWWWASWTHKVSKKHSCITFRRQIGSQVRQVYQFRLRNMAKAVHYTGDLATDPWSACIKEVRARGRKLSVDGYGFHGTKGQNLDSILAAGRLRRGPRPLDTLHAVCFSEKMEVALNDYCDKSSPFAVIFGAHLNHYVKNIRPQSPSKYVLAHEAWINLTDLYLVWNDAQLPIDLFVLSPGEVRKQPQYVGPIPLSEVQCNWRAWTGP